MGPMSYEDWMRLKAMQDDPQQQAPQGAPTGFDLMAALRGGQFGAPTDGQTQSGSSDPDIGAIMSALRNGGTQRQSPPQEDRPTVQQTMPYIIDQDNPPKPGPPTNVPRSYLPWAKPGLDYLTPEIDPRNPPKPAQQTLMGSQFDYLRRRF